MPSASLSSRPRRPVSVVFLTPNILMGGAERWILSLLEKCDRSAVRFAGVACLEPTPAEPDLVRRFAARAPVYGVLSPLNAPPEKDNRREAAIANFRRLATVDSAIRAVTSTAPAGPPPDIVITWGIPSLDRLLSHYRISRHSGRIVVVSHGSSYLTTKLLYASVLGATHFAAVSEAAASSFPPGLPVTVIPNGADTERCRQLIPRDEMRARWGISSDDRIIGYVGRFALEKNPIAAAQAAAHMAGNWRAVYVGNGYQESQVRQQVAAIPLAAGRVHFSPYMNQVGDALGAIDAFMLASPAEGFATAIIEAWLSGVPIVATRVGCIPAAEEKFGQLVIPVRVNASPAELARAVRIAVSPFGQEIARRAKAVAKRHFTAEIMAAKWTEYFQRIVDEPAEKFMNRAAVAPEKLPPDPHETKQQRAARERQERAIRRDERRAAREAARLAARERREKSRRGMVCL